MNKFILNITNKLSSGVLIAMLILSPLSIINTASAAVSDPTVTLNGPASVNVGDTFNVPIVFSNFTSLSGGQFRIVFDNTKVQFLSNASGRITSSIGANTTFYDSNHDSGDNAISFASTFIKDNSPANNTVSATATEVSILTGTFSDSAGENFTTQDNSSSVSNGTFITLKFKAIASGNPNIRFEDGAVAAGAIFANTVGTPSGNIEIFNLVNATTIVAANISSAPIINTQPSQNISATVGQTSSLPSLSISATNASGTSETLSYQWQKATTSNQEADFYNIENATTSTYEIQASEVSSEAVNQASIKGVYYYKVIINNQEAGKDKNSTSSTISTLTVSQSSTTIPEISNINWSGSTVSWTTNLDTNYYTEHGSSTATDTSITNNSYTFPAGINSKTIYIANNLSLNATNTYTLVNTQSPTIGSIQALADNKLSQAELHGGFDIFGNRDINSIITISIKDENNNIVSSTTQEIATSSERVVYGGRSSNGSDVYIYNAHTYYGFNGSSWVQCHNGVLCTSQGSGVSIPSAVLYFRAFGISPDTGYIAPYIPSYLANLVRNKTYTISVSASQPTSTSNTFYRTISNISTSSTAFVVETSALPVINTQPTSTVSIIVNSSFSLSVGASTSTATSTLSYQWQSCTDNTGTSCTNITDNNTATSSTYTATPTTTGTEYLKVNVYQTENGKLISDALSSNISIINVNPVPAVVISVTGVQVSTTSLSLLTGATSTITATISPNNATNQNITWTTSSSTIATVNNGVVTAISAGTATITATTADGSFTATTSVVIESNVSLAPSITTQPVATLSVGVNSPFSLSVSASTTSAGAVLSYQWQSCTDNTGNTCTDITIAQNSTATSSTYTRTANATGTEYFKVKVRQEESGKLISNETLSNLSTVNIVTLSTAVPVISNVTFGGANNLTVSWATNTASNYYTNNTFSVIDTTINNNSYTFSSTSSPDKTIYLANVDTITATNTYTLVNTKSPTYIAPSILSDNSISDVEIGTGLIIKGNRGTNNTDVNISIRDTAGNLVSGTSKTFSATTSNVYTFRDADLHLVYNADGVRYFFNQQIVVHAWYVCDGGYNASGYCNHASLATPPSIVTNYQKYGLSPDTGYYVEYSVSDLANLNSSSTYRIVISAAQPSDTANTFYKAVATTTSNDFVWYNNQSVSAQITTQPVNSTITDSITSTATFSVIATSTVASSTLTYQWASSTDNITFNNISGATSSTYTTPVQTMRGQSYYRVTVTNTEDGKRSALTISDSASLTVTLESTSATATVTFSSTTATIVPSEAVRFVTSDYITIDTSIATSSGSNEGTYILASDRLKTVYMIDNFGNRSSIDIANIKDITDTTLSSDKLNKYNEFVVKATVDSDSKTIVDIINAISGTVIASKNDLLVDALTNRLSSGGNSILEYRLEGVKYYALDDVVNLGYSCGSSTGWAFAPYPNSNSCGAFTAPAQDRSNLGKVVARFSSNELSGLTSDTDYIIKITSISASSTDTKYYSRSNVIATSSIRSSIFVSGITLSPTTLSLTTGATSTITATISPNTATNQSITWTTSSSTIASVSNGVITAVSAGTATITATTADGSFTATTLVTVTALVTPPANVAVTGVSVNPTTLSLTTGATSTITATISPNTATNQSITWTTSSSTIASVSNRVITAVSAGTATITATTADGSFTATTLVTVIASVTPPANVAVTGVSVNPTTLSLTTGATSTITATISPNTATNQSITWTTSSSTIASVSNGVITAVSAGTATVTATTADGSFTATTLVTVTALVTPPANVAVTGVSVNPTTLSLTTGATSTITATISPNTATNQSITWTTSSSTIASVSNGVITAVSAGTATVTATTADGSFTATTLVTVTALVTPPAPAYTPNIITQPSSRSIEINNSTTFSVSANVSAGSLSYQWQSSINNNTFTNIAGETSSSYTTPTQSATGTSYYRVAITNTENNKSSVTTYSQSVSLIVSNIAPASTPVLSSQLSNKSIVIDNSATFSISASVSSGSGSLSYQWASSTDNITFTNISDATSSSYTTPIQSTTGIIYYRIVVTNTEAGRPSSSITSTVALTITPVTPSNVGGGGIISGGGSGYTYNNTKSNVIKTTPVIQIGGAPNNTTNSPNNTYTLEKPFVRDIKINTYSNEVKELQKFLNNKGYMVSSKGAGSPGKETIYFGPATVSAIKKYQKANGLRKTGLLDTATRNVINKLINNTPKSTPVNNPNNNISTTTTSTNNTSTSTQNIIENKSEIVVQPIINNSNKRNVNKVAPVVIVNI